MMKLIHFPILSLLLATSATAADLSPNNLGPLSNVAQHLMQGPLAKETYRLGLDFVESQTYIMDPAESDPEAQKVIQRRLNLEVGLPWDSEFGLSLMNTQEGYIPESTAAYAAADQSTKPLGLKAWLRWTAIHNSWVSTSLTLQYQPGLADAASYHKASQDRSSLGLDLKIHPYQGIEAAVYSSYSRRKDERYRDQLLGDEKLFGIRLALGTEQLGVFGDAATRYLQSSHSLDQSSKNFFARQYMAGLYVGTQDIKLSAFAIIPDKNRYIGVPERGFGASLSVRLGGGSSASTSEPSANAVSAVDKADRSDPSKNAQQLPIKEAEAKIIETNEPDEFQLLNERNAKNSLKNHTETVAEKAEREMRGDLEKEQKKATQKALEEKQRQVNEAEELKQQIRQDDDRVQEYKDDVDQEINRYALPDAEELDWNGLTSP